MDGYKDGQQAQAKRIAELEAEIEKLEWSLAKSFDKVKAKDAELERLRAALESVLPYLPDHCIERDDAMEALTRIPL